MKPALDDAGVKLICVGIGSSESAQKFAAALPFPEDSLYIDEAREAYKALELYGDLDGTEGWFFDPKVVEGVRRLFFNDATSNAMKKKIETGSMKEVMKKYKPGFIPKDMIGTVQQGGLFVFKGRQIVYGHKDQGTGDHAEPQEVLKAMDCGCE
mmetsp:Transcript_19509/g.23382  ORF Transcript_19509/g.23382 Transcript_19509/m.23382 type:complete len:154 (-) Transcript_19509:232-693(-)